MSFTIALAGNPNSGKTTLFNALTGATAHVGNWPGVTVEKKDGIIKKTKDVLVDLPGIYSLSPYSLEEVLSRDFITAEKPDAIINIIDATNIERSLYLTTQLLEMKVPMVIACNFMDLVRKNGDTVNIEALGTILDVPVVEISALHVTNLDELINAAHAAAEQRKISSFKLDYGTDIESIISKFETQLMKHPEAPADTLSRWAAIKQFEQDEALLKVYPLNSADIAAISEMEKREDDNAQAIISTKRYEFIAGILPKVHKDYASKEKVLTERIDRIVTNRWLALPIFAAIIFFIYWLSISTIGTKATDFVNEVIIPEWVQTPLRSAMEGAGVSGVLIGLVVDGIVAGVGAVLGFLPQMAVLFLCLAILEQCGYMSRIAFILDLIFKKFGLSGKSFIPMLVGTGCSVPGIMAARTIENEADRRITAITTSFMPCSAKLPIIAFIAGAIFKGAWWFAPITYFLGIGAIIVSGIVLKKFKAFAGDPTPFVMELPIYQLPLIKNILLQVWKSLSAFIKKAGTIILVSSIVTWTLLYFGYTAEGFTAVGDEIDKSLLARIGNTIAWIFKPLGFGDWQSTVATIQGLVAKENVMSTFGIIFGIGEDVLDLIEGADWGALQAITAHYTPITAFSFLSFNLLCAPCFAAIGAMHRELSDTRWTIFGLLFQTLLAYSFALVFYQFAIAFTGAGLTWKTAVAVVVLAVWLFLLFRPQKRDELRLQ